MFTTILLPLNLHDTNTNVFEMIFVKNKLSNRLDLCADHDALSRVSTHLQDLIHFLKQTTHYFLSLLLFSGVEFAIVT